MSEKIENIKYVVKKSEGTFFHQINSKIDSFQNYPISIQLENNRNKEGLQVQEPLIIETWSNEKEFFKVDNFYKSDETLFPQRIKATATVLKENKQFGKFEISHVNGELKISRIKNNEIYNTGSISKKVLFSWIGTQDYLASENSDQDGPILSTVNYKDFEKIILLHNKKIDTERYISWLQKQTTADVVSFKVEIDDPTDFERIYKNCKNVISEFNKDYDDFSDYYFLVSAGTWAMASVWIILSQKEFPATLLKASRETNSVMKVKIPFEVSVHWFEEKIKETDAAISEMRENFLKFSQNGFLWESDSMSALLKNVQKVAPRNLPIIIEGEPGTEKEALAKTIHFSSQKTDKDFIHHDCNTADEMEMEKSLLNLNQDYKRSNFGTIYIHSIEKLSRRNQNILYSRLKEFQKSDEINFPRLIVSSAISIRDLYHLESFSNDLLHLISMMILKVPALRHRKSDLDLFLDQSIFFATKKIYGKTTKLEKKLSPAAKTFLINYEWYGNLDELYSALTRMIVLSENEIISESDAIGSVFVNNNLEKDSKEILNRTLEKGIDLNSIFSEVARHYIPRALDIAEGNKKRAAELLGMQSQQTLTNWMQRYLEVD